MKQVILFIINILLVYNAAGNELSSFYGEWSGDCVHQNYNTDNPLSPYQMTLKIAPDLSERDHLVWQISYTSQPMRNYRLRPAGTKLANHFILDENNGILIDLFVTNNEIHDLYSINGKVFRSTKSLVGSNQMIINGQSYWANPIRTTQSGPNKNVVKSFALRDSYKCTLQKR